MSKEEARQYGNFSVELAAAGRWPEALAHAHACHRLAPAGSLLAAWALHMLACTYVDAGLPHRARAYARAYLKQASAFPRLEHYTPFVLHAMGSACYQQRQWNQAMGFSRAMTAFAQSGKQSNAAITTHNLAWSMVRSGRYSDARLILAARNQFPPHLAYLRDGVEAAILAAEGEYQAAIDTGRQALSSPDRRPCDFADAAEVALVLAESWRTLGETGIASAFKQSAADLLTLQKWDAVVRLLLNERAEGGDPSERAASSRGSANLLHRGCFTSGVA